MMLLTPSHTSPETLLEENSLGTSSVATGKKSSTGSVSSALCLNVFTSACLSLCQSLCMSVCVSVCLHVYV